jgi:hypothetical protein
VESLFLNSPIEEIKPNICAKSFAIISDQLMHFLFDETFRLSGSFGVRWMKQSVHRFSKNT